MSIDTRAWMDDGACVGNGLPWVADLDQCTRVDLAAMGAVCGGCPVRGACSEFAVGVQVGFWAGSHREPVQPVALWQQRQGTSAWVQTVLPLDLPGTSA